MSNSQTETPLETPPVTSTPAASPTKEEKPQRPSNLLTSAQLSASASSLASVASSKASVATTKSGIRPPSKIGRLCGDKHKPPVPSSPPRSNDVDDPLNKMIDEFGRHRLTDVLEEEFEEDQAGRPWNGSVNRIRYPSSSPASSMDALWEQHPHRLSEAGLSRHSDSSGILTEDTDSFIIGQRVWVGGTKPGHIAFIGETQFAPGEWAGIALDEPIGKNDGSVGGIHYFQCEPKKGVFARLTRLTRVPLSQEHIGSGESFSYSSPLNGTARKSPMSPSPTESHRSMVKSPGSVCASNTSLSSAYVDYRVGDRVIIKSSQGSKVGTVRFMGVTEFAPGEWVGVELDEPRGKNDGSVNGIRYFECQPNFGLFSPISKVSKSPSKIKPGQCQIHSTSTSGGLPPSGLKRTNSKESLTSNLSMMSSASTAARRKAPIKSSATPVPTRTALQDVLKEKQQHIEQLLKERDLERAEITRAASQADEAEQKYALLRQEYDKYRAECEVQLKEHIALLNQLKESRNELMVQLEDEKKKNEDWQFKFEEAEITKVDFEALNESNTLKIKELESSLAVEREKVENLEAEAQKLFEADENLMKAKEEIENLKKELQETRNKHVALEGDTVTTTVLIKSLQDDLDQTKKECDEKSEMINVLKKEISSLLSEQESLNTKVESFELKISKMEEECSQKDKDKEALQLELENVNKVVTERNKTIEKLQAENLSIENTLQKEHDKLKMELSAKINDLEVLTDKLTSTEATLNDLRKNLEEASVNLELKNQELLQYQSNLGDLATKYKDELDKVQSELQKQIEKQKCLEKDMNMKLSEKEVELDKFIKLNDESNTTINNLNIVIDNLKSTYEENSKETHKKHLEEIETLREEIEKLISKNKQMESELQTLSEEDNKAIADFNIKLSESNKQVQELTKDLEDLKRISDQNYKDLENKLNEEIDARNNKIEQLNLVIQDKTDQNNTLLDELNAIKLSLEQKNKDFNVLSDSYDNLKSKLEDELKLKIADLQKATDEIELKNNLIFSLQSELQTNKMDLERVSKDLLQYQTNLTDVEAKLKKECDELHETLKLKINEIDNLRKELSDTISHKDQNIAELSSKVKEQSEETVKLKNQLDKQKEGFEKITNELVEHQKVEISQRDETVSQVSFELKQKQDEIILLNQKISELESLINEKSTETAKIKDDIGSLKDQVNNDAILIEGLKEEINNLTQHRADLETRNDELMQSKHLLESNNTQYENELKSKETEIKEAIKTIELKESQLNELNLELNNYKMQYDRISNEMVQYQNNLSDVENSLRHERDKIQINLDAKINELQNTSAELSQVKLNYEKQVEETSSILKEKDAIKENLEEKTRELEKVKKEILEMNNNLEGKLNNENTLRLELDNLILELNNKNSELEKVKTDLSEVVRDLEKKLSETNTVVSQKTECISKKEEEIIQLTEDQKKLINELMEDHKSKISQSTKIISDLEVAIKGKTEESGNLTSTIQERDSLLKNKNEEISKLSEELINLKKDKEEVNIDVIRAQDVIKALEKEKEENKAKIEQLEKDLSKITSEKDNLNQQIQSSNNKMNDIEEVRKLLIEKDQVIESINIELEKAKMSNEKSLIEQNEKIKAIENSEALLKTMVAEMQNDLTEVSNLEANIRKLEEGISKRDIEIMKKDNEIRKLKELLSQQRSEPSNAGDGGIDAISPDHQQLLEEKAIIEGQVAFLNSIIVDMQKKNEEQRHKIEILEMGYSPAAVDELNIMGFKSGMAKQPAPRMYCDICEEFDLHETEDCPTQCSDEPISNSQLNKEKKEKPSPRPYCEICGEFGHDTENCTDDQEY